MNLLPEVCIAREIIFILCYFDNNYYFISTPRFNAGKTEKALQKPDDNFAQNSITRSQTIWTEHEISEGPILKHRATTTRTK